jgi:hypothetical protein
MMRVWTLREVAEEIQSQACASTTGQAGKIESHSRELVDFLTVSTIRALATVFGLSHTTVVRLA